MSDSEDDEFDALFSFGGTPQKEDVGTTTLLNNKTATTTSSSSSQSSSSSSSFLKIDSTTITADNLLGGVGGSITTQNKNDSNHKSAPNSNFNDHDDDFDILDNITTSNNTSGVITNTNTKFLGRNNSSHLSSNHEDDDFHGMMDVDTREFLDWLDQPASTSTSAAVANTSLGELSSSNNITKATESPATMDIQFSNSEDDEDDILNIHKFDQDQEEENLNESDDDSIDLVDMDIDVVDQPTNSVSVSEIVAAEPIVESEVHSSSSLNSVSNLQPASLSERKSSLDKVDNQSPVMDDVNTNNEQLLTTVPSTKETQEANTTQSESDEKTNTTLLSEPQLQIDSDENQDTVKETETNENVSSNIADSNANSNPVFHSLLEALQSSESTMQSHILPFLYPSLTSYATSTTTPGHPDALNTTTSTSTSLLISPDDRKHLWTKAICSKTLSDIQSSSLADSFVNWNKRFDYNAFIDKRNTYGHVESFVTKVCVEVDILVETLIKPSIHSLDSNESDDVVINNMKKDLCSLMLFHYQKDVIRACYDAVSTKKNNDAGKKDITQPTSSENESSTDNVEEAGSAAKSPSEGSSDSEMKISSDATINQSESGEEISSNSTNDIKEVNVEWNELLAPIAAILLSVSIPASVASVMLSTIVASSLPLIALSAGERLDAAKSLHSQLYLLACYHLPLLVLHLDRNVPGWYWPKSVNPHEDQTIVNNEGVPLQQDESSVMSATQKRRCDEDHGVIPMTWFTSNLSGIFIQDPNKIQFRVERLLHLWDVLLTLNDKSLEFFLALALLEKHSDELLMLRGEELFEQLQAVMSFQKTSMEVASFVGYDDSTNQYSSDDGNEFIKAWCDQAKVLRDSTPTTFVKELQIVEDKAITKMLKLRQKAEIEKMKYRLEAEAEAHRKAIEEERSKKEIDAQSSLYKSRLEMFYKKHCPEKVGSVDKILEVYKGRELLLDKRLADKYGSGFMPVIPVVNPKLSATTNRLISTMGHGIQSRRKNLAVTRADEQMKKLDESIMSSSSTRQVTLTLSASEIIPTLCGIQTEKCATNLSHETLKFYLVDSRPDNIASVQGRFPKAARLSPEDLMDPDRIQQQIDMFESLRGAVHICIMGEGFSSFPTLYDHPLSVDERRLLSDDESHTNMCALFFLKRGFPFVSVLDGGFASAHAWLSRNTTGIPLSSILVDYDEEKSLFAQLEESHKEHLSFANASTRQKTTKVLQKLIDNSMVSLTIQERKLEDFTERLLSTEGRGKVKQSSAKASNADNNKQDISKRSSSPSKSSVTLMSEGESSSTSLVLENPSPIQSNPSNTDDDKIERRSQSPTKEGNPFKLSVPVRWRGGTENKKFDTTNETKNEMHDANPESNPKNPFQKMNTLFNRRDDVSKGVKGKGFDFSRLSKGLNKNSFKGDIESATDVGIKRNIFSKIGGSKATSSTSSDDKDLELEIDAVIKNFESDDKEAKNIQASKQIFAASFLKRNDPIGDKKNESSTGGNKPFSRFGSIVGPNTRRQSIDSSKDLERASEETVSFDSVVEQV